MIEADVFTEQIGAGLIPSRPYGMAIWPPRASGLRGHGCHFHDGSAGGIVDALRRAPLSIVTGPAVANGASGWVASMQACIDVKTTLLQRLGQHLRRGVRVYPVATRRKPSKPNIDAIAPVSNAAPPRIRIPSSRF